LIDQSKSMRGSLGGDSARKKMDAVAESVNRMIYSLVLRCVWGQAVLDRFQIGVIGYGREIISGMDGALTGRDLVPISEVANSPLRVEQRVTQADDGMGGKFDQTIRFPIWFEARAEGKTPMNATFERAEMILAGFLAEHPACFPPMVINITDGDSSDGDPEQAAYRLRRLNSEDGDVLLFNIHLSSTQAQPIEFPDSELGLPDNFASMLFRMSSCLPPGMHAPARQAGINVTPQTRGFVFNADLAAIVRFLDIGTRVDFNNI
jgi:hypothetical protein